jgi:predicted acylesterase/phospholipase RssA
MLLGFGLFMIPVAGPLIVLGPLGGLIAGAISGAGVGALISGLMALGMDREKALKYQARLQAGDFLVTVAGTHGEVERARQILHDSGHTEVEQFQMRETA